MNAMDFDDLLMKAVQLLERFPERLATLPARASASCSSTSTRTPTTRSTAWPACSPRSTATSAWWATTTSRIYALARRRHPQHPRVRARLPRRGGRPAGAELPLHADHPRRRQRGRSTRNRGRKGKSLWTDRAARARSSRSSSVDDEHAEAQFVAIEVQKRWQVAGARRRSDGRDRRALPHQRAVARAGRSSWSATAIPYQLIGGVEVLRARRGARRARVPARRW